MTGLVLDECISPSIGGRLWSEGIDNWHVRDRGLLQISDHYLFSLAQAERRVVVTINAGDFRKLCAENASHAGVLAISSGGNRDKQFEMVMQGIAWARETGAELSRFSGHFAEVSVVGDISIDLTLPHTKNVVPMVRRRN